MKEAQHKYRYSPARPTAQAHARLLARAPTGARRLRAGAAACPPCAPLRAGAPRFDVRALRALQEISFWRHALARRRNRCPGLERRGWGGGGRRMHPAPRAQVPATHPLQQVSPPLGALRLLALGRPRARSRPLGALRLSALGSARALSAPRAGRPGSAMDKSCHAAIAQSLRRWKRDGYDFDWRNPEHVAAYQLARESSPRPRPGDVLRILATNQITHESAAKFSVEFWLVPRSNFSAPPPQQVVDNTISEAELADNYAMPADFDFSSVWVVDMMCPRNLLGPRVRKMSFEESLRRKMTDANPASERAADSAPDGFALMGGAAPATPESCTSWGSGSTAVQQGSTHLAPARSTLTAPRRLSGAEPGRSGKNDTGPCGAGALDGASAAPARRPAPEPEPAEQPPPKTARVLQMMGSDPVPPAEKEAGDWQMLLNKINKCAKAGSFHSSDVSCCGTVFFWTKQVVAALEAAGLRSDQAKKVNLFTEGFLGFLLRVLCAKQWVGVG